MTQADGHGVASFKQILVGAILGAAVLASLLVVAPWGSVGNIVLADGAAVLTSVVATLSMAWRARAGRDQEVWLWLTMGTGAFAVAEAYWFVREALLQQRIPLVSPADAWYLIGYVGLAVGLLASFPGRQRAWPTVRRALDMLVLLLTLLGIGWLVGIRSLLADGEASTLGAILAAGYPMLNIVLVTFLTVAYYEVQALHRDRTMLAMLAFAVWTVIDLAYAGAALSGGSVADAALAALWPLGYFLLAGVALVRPEANASPSGPVPPRAVTQIVFLPVAALLVLTVMDYGRRGGLDATLFGIGVALVALLVLRQMLFVQEIRARHRALKEETARLERAQAVAHLGSWGLDLATGTLVWSRETFRIHGVDPDRFEPSYEAFLALVHPDDRERVDHEYRSSVVEARPIAIDHRIVRPDGQVRHVQQRGGTEKDDKGKLRSVGSVQDVTDRRMIEEGLRFQAHLLDSVGESLAAVDTEGRITYWNHAAEQMYGWHADEAIGRPALDFLPHPDGHAQLAAATARLGAGDSFSGEYRLKRKDGSDIIVDVRTDPILEDGALVGFMSIGRDVTERREMEQGLRFQSHLLDSVGQAVMATDLEGRITYWNRAATELYGWRPDEVLGRPVLDVTPSEQRGEEALQIFERLRQGQEWQGEFTVRRKDGSAFVAHVHNTPVMDANGELVGIIGVSQDISERKELEAQARERAKELAALYAVARQSAESDDIHDVVQVAVKALEPAFLHDDTWVDVAVGDTAASSSGDPPAQPCLTATFTTELGPGRVEVRYRGPHDEQAIGPFLEEEQDLLDGVGELITAAVQRAHALQQVSRREADLLETQAMAHLGSWSWNPSDDSGWWSDEMYRIFERPEESGPPAIEEALRHAPEDGQRVRSALERLVQTGGRYETDMGLRLPDGTRKVVTLWAEVVSTKGPAPLIRGTMQDVTERHAAKQRLAFQANLLAEVRHAVFSTSIDGDITYWNPGAERLYGWRRDEALGRPVQDVLGSALTEEAAEAGSSDHWVARKDGTKVLVSLSSSPLLDSDGKLVGFIGVSEDVTQERATQQRYQQIVEHTPDGIFRTTPDGSLEYANPASAAILGYETQTQLLEEVERVTDLYVDLADRQRLLRELEKATPAPVEAPLRRRDGSSVWVEIRARLHRVPGGRAIIEGTFHDLTARREREEMAQRLAAIIASSEEAIYSKDLDGVVQTWNPGAERLFGYSASEALGEKAEALIVPEDRIAEYLRFMERVRAGHAVGRFDTTRRRKDGALVDVSIAVTPLRDADGNPIAASVSAHDISDRKRAEEAERARIENEHLKKMDQTLRDFINAAAHDLNQPLTPMKIALATLGDYTRDLPEGAHQTVDMLKRNVDRMALLLQDLLDVARLESGTLRFDIEETRLDDLLHETVRFFGMQAKQHDIDIEVLEHPDLHVHADPRRIIQVLFNLVGNAMKFTPEGGRITIEAQPEDGHARVAVVDTGSGLTDEQIGKLFQAFKQVHGPGGPKGTGLGLYISKGIIEHHGGEIGAKSAGPGKGSTFWFTIPRALIPRTPR